MNREQIKTDYTEDEIKNLEAKKCWCGKPRSEFDKGLRVYCSVKHRNDWYSRTITWGSFKDQILEKQGKKCAICSIVEGDNKIKEKQAIDEWMKKIKSLPNFKQMLDQARITELKELEEKYENIMNDDWMIEHELYWKNRNDIPEKPHEFSFEVRFEVDHIVAVCNGGAMWDENNLRVLCTECHKDKTKQDMKLFRSKKN